MLRTQPRSGIASMNMGHKEQKRFIAGPAAKTVSILKSETIEMRNDRPDASLINVTREE